MHSRSAMHLFLFVSNYHGLVSRHACLSLPACLPACLSLCLPVSLHACPSLPACLPASLSLSPCLSACLSVFFCRFNCYHFLIFQSKEKPQMVVKFGFIFCNPRN